MVVMVLLLLLSGDIEMNPGPLGECLNWCATHLVAMVLLIYRIAGNFREVQIFAIFVTHDQNANIKTAKI